MKAKRNKTIDTPLSEGQHFLESCLRLVEPLPLAELSNQVIWGDSFEVLPLLPPRSMDLIVVDPPYNLRKEYAGQTFSKLKAQRYAEYTQAWLQLVVPLLKEGGSLYLCCDWESGLTVGPLLGQYLKIRNRITWQREKGRGANRNWKNGLEDIWFATQGEEYTFNLEAVKCRRRVLAPYRHQGLPKDWQETEGGRYRDTCPSNLWDDITVPFWSMAENTAHPTQKPEKLLAKLILASSNPGDLVFDPFLGSGTTCVVAKKLGRRYLGIEKSSQYCLWAQERLERAAQDPTIQGYTQGIFWERNTLPPS